jgi:predicted outer membrane protein
MNGLARNIKESSEGFRKEMKESHEAFTKEMRDSHEAFTKEMRDSHEAFTKEMRDSHESFSKRMEASSEAFAKEMRDSHEAFSKKMEASSEAFAKEMRDARSESEKQWNKKMGEIYNRLGDLAEYTFVPEAILEKFKELGYEFDNYCRRERVIGEDGCARAEYDVVLRNGDTVALVEIKSFFRYEYIDRFIRQISVATNEKYRGKRIIAAIAALELPKEVKNYALDKGLYVIEQAGQDIKIDTQDGKFKPRIW